MSRSWSAELVKLVRRPASWLLLAIALALSLAFTYLLPYASIVGGTGGPNSERTLPMLLPDRLVGNSLGGLPIFLGAIVLIIGVLVVGGEYGWGTWKTLLAQGSEPTGGVRRQAVHPGHRRARGGARCLCRGCGHQWLIAVTESSRCAGRPSANC